MKKYLISVLSLTLASCSTIGGGKAMAKTNDASIKSIQVYVSERCPIKYGATDPAGSQALISALGSILIGGVIDQGLSTFSTALKNSAAKKVTKHSSRRLVDLMERTEQKTDYSPADKTDAQALIAAETFALNFKPTKLQLSKNLGCILVVGGEFSSTADLNTTVPFTFKYKEPNMLTLANLTDKPDDIKGLKDERILKHLKAAGLDLLSTPDFVYEAEFKHSNHKDAFWLNSTFLHVGDFQAKNNVGRGSKKGMGITLTIDAPSPKQDASTLRAMDIQFGNIKKGTTYIEGSFPKGDRSSLMQAITVDKNAASKFAAITQLESLIKTTKASLDTNRKMLERATADLKKDPTNDTKKRAVEDKKTLIENDEKTLVSSIKKYLGLHGSSRSYMPTELTATIIETRNESEFLKFMSGVFEKSSKSVGEELKNRLVPKNVQEAKDKEKTTSEALEDKLSAARVDYLSKKKVLENLQDGADLYDRQIAEENYLKALRSYNRALIESDLPTITE